MTPHDSAARGRRTRAGRAVVAAGLACVLLAAACTADEDGSPDAESAGAPEGPAADELLGPEDPAAGEPVRIGMVSDGQTDAFDARDEVRAAQATVDWWNERRAGIGGRPIELVTCETGADPAGGTDCGNRMIEDDVVAVVIGQSTVPDAIWEPLDQAGIPTMFFQTNGDAVLADPDTSFTISNPLTTAFGLPISVAQDEGAERIAFVVIDVPVAVSLFESLGPQIVGNAGLDHELVRVPPGTPDMVAQMRDIVESGAGVVQVVGYDAFCIAAFQGLAAAGYDGEITAVSQCITDATREAMPGGQLEGLYVTSGVALGAADDPTFQQYEAVMEAYGEDVEDVDNNVPMVGYSVVGALATSLDGLSGDIAPATVAEAIRAMPDLDLPGGGGVTFRCGGSAMATMPGVCSNQWLLTALDADGHPGSYEAVDSTGILEGL
jgi:branched-chain amino acid transport system substrate-binding protein